MIVGDEILNAEAELVEVANALNLVCPLFGTR